VPADDTASGTGGNFTEPTTPVECLCTTQTCGAGMLNAAAAVTQALAAFVQITASSTTGHPGQKITLDGSGSTAAVGHTIKSYLWTTDPSTSDQLSDPTQSITTLVVPSFRSITVILTITDDAGTQSSASQLIESDIAAAAGHTGGAFGPLWLSLLAALSVWQLYRRQRRPAKLLN
jgi:serine protease